jgi:hypothetical protein
MYNFYEYLNISNTAEVLDIILAYKNKILSYNQCDNFTERQIYEIKILKIALYILTNKNLRKKYDKLLILKNKKEFISKNSININTVNSKALLSNLNIQTSHDQNQNINIYENKPILDKNNIESDSIAPQELSKQKNDNILSIKKSLEKNNTNQTINNTEGCDNKNHSNQLKSNNNEEIYEENSTMLGSNFLELEFKNQVETLDNLFEIDNSWMKNINDINNNGYLGRKKNQIESHSIMDRIFSIPIQTNKKYPNNLN